MELDFSAYRKEWLNWIKKQLQGPPERQALQEECLTLEGISPLERYPVAVLYPVIAGEGLDAAETEFSDDESGVESVANSGVDDADNKTAQSAQLSRYVPPSSVGFSFFIPTANWCLAIGFSAASYKKTNNRDEPSGHFKNLSYQRIALGRDEEAVTITQPGRFDVMPETAGGDNYRAAIDVRSRSHKNGSLITVSLLNTQHVDSQIEAKEFRQQEIERTLFETELYCLIESGEVGNYPNVEYSLLDDEMQELELQYQHKKIYAVGHGAAVDWQLNAQGNVQKILTDFLPQVEVPQMTADVLNTASPVLSMAFLKQSELQPEMVLKALEYFVDGYGNWMGKQALIQLTTEQQPAADRILERMRKAKQRMLEGIELLRHDPLARQAFAYANQVMLEQMQQAVQCSGKLRLLDEYCWRPFQLAFFLTVLKSSIDENDHERDTVDLIWFPTGGGKTEAYLGLIAFVIIWRRMRFPQSGGGTTAFMRYTLRLLTTQQYLRACRMICALELLRQQQVDALGNESITIGLWVGSATSPNNYNAACKILEKHTGNNKASLPAFVLQCCPWCNTPFAAAHNYRATHHSFEFICTGKNCEFADGQQILPCNVVDDALYAAPPTLLLATVDKFAQLLWEERARRFFGVNGQRPPELIIQDELHLIASALGSVSGVYEAGIETVLQAQGIYPKYIASTATIRMAKEQVQALYAKDVAVFPPPGLSADDSFFAKTVPITERPGRLYVGYFAARLNRQRSLGPLVASVLAAPELVFDTARNNSEALREAWWTQLIYHGSLRGVGNTQNALSLDVRNYYERLLEEAFQLAISEDFVNPDLGKGTQGAVLQNRKQAWLHEQRISERFAQSPALLTSQSSPEENAQTFSALEKHRGEIGCIDTALATNMVSVGLDTSRLAVMIINGQPLTTAEYIQASSRVGRSDVPGVVCVNYYRDQTRSLSHYENFRPYHESFYRYVEPSSVTPYTYQARRRALHAALVLALRYAVPALLANDAAGRLNTDDPSTQRVVNLFIQRCAAADPSRKDAIRQHINDLLAQWQEKAERCRDRKRALHYQVRSKEQGADRLLYVHGDNVIGLWPTLQSMRNVESTGLLKGL
ncbi:MAG TPA: helicase-related protein [Marinospirillum sp.]|uniref:helicase-related protein n=1 Tax=Marinospirillum sp. TaxID=2183934 RepID=UPI002B495222|nr:helicase-related protein [Marinospirillum sp.]HKM15563.1 helicase-related protein [Marinospirillum sp.]